MPKHVARRSRRSISNSTDDAAHKPSDDQAKVASYAAHAAERFGNRPAEVERLPEGRRRLSGSA
jgi:hypothetical protein